jgi:hypothetical protein
MSDRNPIDRTAELRALIKTLDWMVENQRKIVAGLEEQARRARELLAEVESADRRGSGATAH